MGLAARTAVVLPPRTAEPGGTGRLRWSLSERKALLLLCDLLIANGSVLLTHALDGRYLDLNHAIVWTVLLSAIWLVMASALDCYDLVTAANSIRSMRRASLAAGLALLAFYLVPYWAPPLPTSRALIAVNVSLLGLPLIAWRLLYPLLLTRPTFRTRVLILGSDPIALAVEDHLTRLAVSDYSVQARIEVDDAPADDATVAAAIKQHVARHNTHEVVVGLPSRLPPHLQAALMELAEQGIIILTARQVYETLTGRVLLPFVDPEWIASLPSNRGLYASARRALDCLVALLCLLLLLPVLTVAALAVKLDSTGPAFYRQQRVGRFGRPFYVAKLRTMVQDAEEQGAVWARSGDPRVTRVGRWLRRTRLDEAPQFWNVLVGDMSLIGPRPERPEFVSLLSAEIPMYGARHVIQPGITGWAQVRYGYGGTVPDAAIKLQYDLYYLRHRSPLLDAVILLKTAAVVLRLQGT